MQLDIAVSRREWPLRGPAVMTYDAELQTTIDADVAATTVDFQYSFPQSMNSGIPPPNFYCEPISSFQRSCPHILNVRTKLGLYVLDTFAAAAWLHDSYSWLKVLVLLNNSSWFMGYEANVDNGAVTRLHEHE